MGLRLIATRSECHRCRGLRGLHQKMVVSTLVRCDLSDSQNPRGTSRPSIVKAGSKGHGLTDVFVVLQSQSASNSLGRATF